LKKYQKPGKEAIEAACKIPNLTLLERVLAAEILQIAIRETEYKKYYQYSRVLGLSGSISSNKAFPGWDVD
jgi:hypothetical protein